MATTAFVLEAVLGLNSSPYEEGLNNAESMASKVGSGLQSAARIGMAAVAGATTAVVGFAGSSVRAGMDFDSSMSQVAATMGTTVDQIEDLRAFAQEMGATTAFSATQAADALNYMALAGYDAETSMNMLPTVLNLAAAGGIDLASASDMVTDASSALGLSIGETSEMVDQMALASSRSNTSVEQLGEALLTLGATGANVSGGTQELSTVLGVLADNGIKGSEAGTHMRNILLSLQDAAGDTGMISFNNGIEDVNISLYDAEGNMRSLIDVISEMQTGMESMTQQSRDAVISGIFNRGDLASANALLATSTDRFYELYDAIGDADGAAQAMAETQLDNLAGDVTLFQSALEGAKIAISDALTPSLREFVQMGSEGLSAITQGFQEGGLEGAMDALGNWLSDALTKIVEMTPDIIRAGMTLLSALGQALIDNAPTILDSAIEVMQMLVDSFVEAVNGDGGTSLMETAMMIIQRLGEFIVTNAPALIEATAQLISQFVTFVADPSNQEMIIELSLQIIEALADGLVQAMPIIAQLIPMLIASNIQVAIAEFPKLIQTIGTLVTDLFLMIVGLVGGFMGLTQDEIMGRIEAVWNFLGNAFSLAIGMVSNTVTGIAGFISNMWVSVGEFFVNGIANVGDALSGWWDELTSWFSNLADSALEWAGDLIDNFVSGLTSGVSAIGDAVSGIADTVASYLHFSEPDIGPLSNFHTYAPDMIDLFTEGIYAGRNQVSNAFDDVLAYPSTSDLEYGTVNASISPLNAPNQASDGQTIIIPIYLGNEQIDEIVINSNQRSNYIAGGRG